MAPSLTARGVTLAQVAAVHFTRKRPPCKDWGFLQRRRAVFRREARCSYKSVGWWRRRRIARRSRRWTTAKAVTSVIRRARFHGVIRRHGEERSRRLCALHVRHRIGGSAEAWIGARALDHHLQIRRIPAFKDNVDVTVVADAPLRNRVCNTRVFSVKGRAISVHAINGLRPERFFAEFCAIHFWLARAALLRLATIVGSHVHLVSDFFFGIEHVMRAGDGIVDHHHGVRFAIGRERTESRKGHFAARAALAITVKRARRGAVDDRAVWKRLRGIGRCSGRKWRTLHYLSGMHSLEAKQFNALAKGSRRSALFRHARLQHELWRRRRILSKRGADAQGHCAACDQRSSKIAIHSFLLFSPAALQN